MQFWVGYAVSETARRPDHEVDEVEWVPITHALDRLTYDDERGVLAEALAMPADYAVEFDLEGLIRMDGAAKAEAEVRERKDREAQIAAEATANAERAAAESIERERKAKEQAEQLARDTAERAKKQAQEAAERAEREKAEAVARAKADAKRKAEAAEKSRLDAIEQERIATEKREANKKHCAKINNAAANALLACGITTEQAKAVVSAIAKGQIPAVYISY